MGMYLATITYRTETQGIFVMLLKDFKLAIDVNVKM